MLIRSMMMILSLQWSFTAFSAVPSAEKELKMDNPSVYFVGHSLFSFLDELAFLADKAGMPLDKNLQYIGGSSLQNNWQNPHLSRDGNNAREDLKTGNYNILILTERVLPLIKSYEEFDSSVYAAKYTELAAKGNPEVQPYLYETWHGFWVNKWYKKIFSPDWRGRLDKDLILWNKIVEEVNAKNVSQKKMKLIRVGQGMGKIHDDIAAGSAPKLTSIRQLFSDEIHLNNWGNYFVACVHFATIYGKSPEGLPTLGDIPAETAAYFQKIAWQIAG